MTFDSSNIFTLETLTHLNLLRTRCAHMRQPPFYPSFILRRRHPGVRSVDSSPALVQGHHETLKAVPNCLTPRVIPDDPWREENKKIRKKCAMNSIRIIRLCFPSICSVRPLHCPKRLLCWTRQAKRQTISGKAIESTNKLPKSKNKTWTQLFSSCAKYANSKVQTSPHSMLTRKSKYALQLLNHRVRS